MSFEIKQKDYIQYLKNVYDLLQEKKDYITQLDLATGDGDHWANMNMGFEKLVSQSDDFLNISLQEMFKKIGMTMMSVIGGSSGVLYGGAYISASKELAGVDAIGAEELYKVWNAMLLDIMNRGKADVGSKTMIDSLAPAVKALRENIDNGQSMKDLLNDVSEAALNGAEETKKMQALRGRASYQTNKGVGHLDPGAVTMSYQIDELCKYVINNLL